MLNEEEKKEKIKVRTKKWREDNKEKIKEQKRIYRQLNKEKIKEYVKNNIEKIKQNKKAWYDKNKKVKNIIPKEKIKKEKVEKQFLSLEERRIRTNELKNKRITERKKSDPLYKLSENIRKGIYKSITSKGFGKKSRTYEILGCSYEDFKIYIENKFESWMNWDNYGNPNDGLIEPNKTWDVDHIKPLSSATNEKELLELNHYTNLQPLCSYHNRFVKKDNF